MSSVHRSASVPDVSAVRVQGGLASGKVIATTEPLSFWGGVDPSTGKVIDVHHPLSGTSLSGRILVMPTSRGSCSGSGVVLDLILNDRAPKAIIFSGAEEVLTLGAIVAAEMFGRRLPILRATEAAFGIISTASSVTLGETGVDADGVTIPIVELPVEDLVLDEAEAGMLGGSNGTAVAQAMRILCDVAKSSGASKFVSIERGHIDGCIYASPANLAFAEKMLASGATVRVPTTTNAISVDFCNWRSQAIPEQWGVPAARIAECYVQMGCRPTFTCSPYLLADRPKFGEAIAWAESNAVIFANAVLGARTNKHPDFLDLCIAMTGRAPLAGVYIDEHRLPAVTIDVELPESNDASMWPIIGYLAGHLSPDKVPVLRGLARHAPSEENLKALCAAFGTTSAAPMLHIEGVTPEALVPFDRDVPVLNMSADDIQKAWIRLNDGPETIDLVAIGSPHASAAECRELARMFDGRSRHPAVSVIVTAGREIVAEIAADGTLDLLQRAGVRVLSDLCWCSITEPLFPETAKVVMTNSGKYAHYGPGLSGRKVRFGNLANCVEAALTGKSKPRTC